MWRTPALKKSYDVVIIGAGGHGLATAYYLAKNHGLCSIAVLEKGFIGGGNTGRNTQVTRSNYFWPQSAAFFLNARFPVIGGFIQRRGGISRHDAVAWGYARAADAHGVDIIQQCEVTGFEIPDRYLLQNAPCPGGGGHRCRDP